MGTTINFQTISYTSSADGETVAFIPQVQNNATRTISIISVTKEVKQLLPTEFVADTTGGTITLVNGLTLHNGETLFVLYKNTQS